MARLADLAVESLIEEALLTPKPALVDQRGSGAHADLDLPAMLRSAEALRGTFHAMAELAGHALPGQELREGLAGIGRHGERVMLTATGGSNSHRGAIWVLGLLIAAAVQCPGAEDVDRLARTAAAIARWPDRWAPAVASNGRRACSRYGVGGARGEALAGFPHVVGLGLPGLVRGRERGLSREAASLDALMAIMTSLEDTCLLHRGGRRALRTARTGALAVLRAGGAGCARGMAALQLLDKELLALNASPGGSADLLAAALFLDRLGFRPRAGLTQSLEPARPANW